MADNDQSYEVGFGKPPRETRFQPGQSGNPAGRPKGPRSLARDLVDELMEPVAHGEGEAAVTLSTQQAILRALTTRARAGDAKAVATVIQLIDTVNWNYRNYRNVIESED